jgi:hypothetical protein
MHMMIGAISNSYLNYNMYGVSGSNAVGSPATDAVNAASGEDDETKKPGRTSSPEECQTCKNRKYQDGSDEMNVSFKSASHISPQSASAAVRTHEGEHVSNAYAKAEKGNGEVVSANVSIHTAVCPECGRTYVSGGTTNTTIKYPNESNPYQQSRKSQDSLSLVGANLDYAV